MYRYEAYLESGISKHDIDLTSINRFNYLGKVTFSSSIVTIVLYRYKAIP
jgi:hypothetical protein